MLSAISGEGGDCEEVGCAPLPTQDPGHVYGFPCPDCNAARWFYRKSTTNVLVEFLEHAAIASLKITRSLQDLTFAKFIQFKRLKVLVCSVQ